MAHFLCNNPVAENPEEIVHFVYRFKQPYFFGCIREVNIMDAKSTAIEEFGPNIGFMYKDPDDRLKVFYIIVIRHHGSGKTEKMRKALQETANWYANCLNLQNPGSGDKKGGYMLLRDYAKETPGLQILHITKLNRFIVSMERGITSFGDEKDMFRFFYEVLGYKEKQLVPHGEITVLKT